MNKQNYKNFTNFKMNYHFKFETVLIFRGIQKVLIDISPLILFSTLMNYKEKSWEVDIFFVLRNISVFALAQKISVEFQNLIFKINTILHKNLLLSLIQARLGKKFSQFFMPREIFMLA